MPDLLPLTTLFTLMITAMVISGFAGARAYRHVSGDSSVRGMRYGLTWFGGFAAISVIAARFSDLLSPPEVGLLWASLSVGLVGVHPSPATTR
jgi:hypothetical protein